MNLPQLVSVAGGVLSLISIVGASIAVLASTRQKVTIDTLAADNDALRHRVTTIETLEHDCQTRLAKAEMTVKVLTETVTNAQAVNELLSRVEKLDLKVERHFADVLSRLTHKADT